MIPSRRRSANRSVLTFCLGVVAAASTQAGDKVSLENRDHPTGLEMEDLGPVPKDKSTMSFSEDGLHVATVTPSRTKQRVDYDGQPGPEFDTIENWSRGGGPAIRIASNGAHIAYLARRNSTEFLCLDDKEMEMELAVDGDGDGRQIFNFSPDGAHLVYVHNGEDGLSHVFFDNEPDPGFLTVTPPILFSSQGGHYAYLAQNDKGQVVVVDGKPGPPLHDVAGLRFSPDGKHFVYYYSADDQYKVTLDSKAARSLDGAQPESIQFSANGKLGFIARKGTGCVAVVDDKERGACQQMGQLQLSADGRRFAYVSGTSDGESVVVDGKPGRPYEKITSVMFSPDGSRVAYTGHLSTGDYVVVDEQESPPYRFISHFEFAAAGKRYGYVGSTENGVVIVIDGKASKPYRTFRDLAISPDGSRYAYEADLDLSKMSVRQYVGRTHDSEFNIDGKVFPATNIVATLKPSSDPNDKDIFRFSPDSKHLAMASMVPGGAKYVITVDGVDGPTSGWCNRFTFSPDGAHFAYVTREPTRGEGWNTIAVTIDRKVVLSTHVLPSGDTVLIAQAVEDSRNTGIKRVNPNYFEFRDDKKLKFITVKDGKMWRVTVEPGARNIGAGIRRPKNLQNGNRDGKNRENAAKCGREEAAK